MASSADSFVVGNRVYDSESFRGTVRYIGPVATSRNAKTIWIGVEWDKAGRGKHDGSVVASGERVRYFSCQDSFGSFVKPRKLHGGVSFSQAVLEKYGDADDGDSGDMFVRTVQGNVLPIELVGAEKIRQKQSLDRLEQISLEGAKVSSAGNPGECESLCPSVRELNLQDNLLSDWAAVAQISSQLPALTSLLLTGNRMQPCCVPMPLPPLSSAAFSGLTLLVLSRTGLQWASLAWLEPALPQLQELHLAHNHIATLSPDPAASTTAAPTTAAPTTAAAATPAAAATEAVAEEAAAESVATAAAAAVGENGSPPVSPADIVVSEEGAGSAPFIRGWRQLRVLNLTGNSLPWCEVARLAWLPRLSTLMLAQNEVEIVSYPEASAPDWASSPEAKAEATDVTDTAAATAAAAAGSGDGSGDGDGDTAAVAPFASLESLSLSGNRISQWSTADALNAFPSLSTLRLQRNPVTDGLGSSRARQLLIARLPQLRVLNGSEVRGQERFDAENGYLKMVITQVLGQGRDMRGLEEVTAEEWAAVAVTHPRYQPLVDKHGMPPLPSRAATDCTTLSGSIVTVTLRSMIAASCTVAPLTKRLPLSMTVGSVKLLLVRKFKCDPQQQRLFFRPPKSFGHPEALEEDDRPLSYYGVQDGAEILMEMDGE